MENIKHAVYINLDRRTDRRAEFESECDRMGIKTDRFSAVEASPGSVGCAKSHIAVLKMAKANNWDNVLIFEDDYQFVVSKEKFHDQIRRFFDLNIKYDIVMLGYNLIRTSKFNDLLGKVIEAQTTSCYLIHNTFYDKLINNFETNLPLLEKTHDDRFYAIDQCWKALQPAADWYFFRLCLGKQRPGFSDIENKFVSYH